MLPEDLILRLRDRDAAVRKKALDELSEETDPDHLACLIEAISDPVAAVRAHARRLLKKITGRDYAYNRELWSSWWRENAHLACQTCGKRLFDQKLYYRVKTDITSEPREIVITEEDLAEDHQAKIQEICDEMKGRAAEDIEEEVWVRLEYYLCVRCKKAFVRRVRRRSPASPDA